MINFTEAMSKLNKYKVVIEKEKNGFSAYVPELPGCASQGRTVSEATQNIKKAIRLYLWSLKKDKKALQRRVIIKDIAA